MKHQYMLPMARNTRTGQTVKQQDLKGVQFGPAQHRECQMMAQVLAEKLSQRTGDLWVAFSQPYTPNQRD